MKLENNVWKIFQKCDSNVRKRLEITFRKHTESISSLKKIIVVFKKKHEKHFENILYSVFLIFPKMLSGSYEFIVFRHI